MKPGYSRRRLELQLKALCDHQAPRPRLTLVASTQAPPDVDPGPIELTDECELQVTRPLAEERRLLRQARNNGLIIGLAIGVFCGVCMVLG